MASLSPLPSQSTGVRFRRILGFILTICLGGLFVFSGLSKLFSMEAFEWTFVEMGIPWLQVSSILARVFIGLELLLGLFLLAHIQLRRFSFPAALVALIVFTIYLTGLLVTKGNEGNCGCFGDWVYMNPLQSIYKNLAMLAALIFLMATYRPRPHKYSLYIGMVAVMASMATPFIMHPLVANRQGTVLHEAMDLDALYAEEIKPEVDLREGKHIVAFLSLSCPHCRKAAYLLHSIRDQFPEIPIYFIISGSVELREEFFQETHAQDVPQFHFFNREAFVDMAGPGVPAIYWINNGIKERKTSYFQLDPAAMKAWLNP